jgi:class 3 adenylate cyclase
MVDIPDHEFGGGGRMGSARFCRACGLDLRPGARFCDGCGAQASTDADLAEYKQVTVMFADVVGSMRIASALGPERLREIMAKLMQRSTAVVQRYGGTVDKFTGDGLMAVFGAPAALEDHALRACLAALGIQDEMQPLAAEVDRSDGIALRLRIGLNSGQVIAGEMSSGPGGYTAIGEQVGLAQRMESVAPAGGVMLSQSTARLVEHAAVLGEPETVHIKGADDAVFACRLLAVRGEHTQLGRREPTLIGREAEMDTIAEMLDQSINGVGCVATVVGSSGIGKSRMVGDTANVANARGVAVFSTFCESHAREVPYRVVVRLLRTVFAVSDLAPDAARARVHAWLPDADPEDLLLLNDLLGIGDAGVALPAITPDARQRRLAALLNTAAFARKKPALFVIEDVHWIDEASESMLAEFVAAAPSTGSLVLITHRPEYRGALSRAPTARMIALAPLTPAQTVALTTALLGTHPSVTGLVAHIAERAAGNPFFADEIVRDMAERGVLDGDRGAYLCRDAGADISVPSTLQAAIAARIDRLGASAKHALYAGAVIGARFGPDLLSTIQPGAGAGESAIAELLRVELIDEVGVSPRVEYAFRHPLIRAVAYESQLKTRRAELHRRVAAAIEASNPDSADQNAALIAEHLEAAGDLRFAFGWHMRAGAWSMHRDVAAAQISWHRARQVADKLPADDPDRAAHRIAPRALVCGTAWMAGGSVADTGFDELRELCEASGDRASLAVGMAGQVTALAGHRRLREAAQQASELIALVEAIGDRALIVGLLSAATYAKAEVGEMTEALRLAQRVIDLSDADPSFQHLVMGSPLDMATRNRGLMRLCLGIPGWRSDFAEAVRLAASFTPLSHAGAILYKYVVAIPVGALPADAVALRETAEALRIAEQAGDDYTMAIARLARGLVLVHDDGSQRQEGLNLLTDARDTVLKRGFTVNAMAVVDPEIAREKARNGDLDGAIELARSAIDDMFDRGSMFLRGVATTVLVETLLERGADGDLKDAQAAIDRLAAVPTDPGFVLHELPLLRLRALVARARGDDAGCRELMLRYRAEAAAADFAPPVDAMG